MPGSVENLIQGVGYLYSGALNATEPADGDVGDPPASGTWTPLGFTNEGVTITISQEYSELEVDQIADVPGRRLVKREINVATSLAEPTLENLEAILNGGTSATGAGFKNFQPDMPELGTTQPAYIALIFDGFAPGGKMRRLLLRKALQVGDIEVASAKDGQTVFPCEFHGHYVSSTIAPYKVVDEV